MVHNKLGYTPGSPEKGVEYISSDPNEQLGFEIVPLERNWSFIPEFYPSDFTQMKKKELNRYAGSCEGESVSIKSVKNREFHVTGYVLEGEVEIFQALLDYEGEIDLLSPLTPVGGMECFISKGELGNQSGYDPHNRQWIFEFTLDLVSTGRDEYDNEENEIVSAIIGEDEEEKSTSKCEYQGRLRSNYKYRYPNADNAEIYEKWVNCNLTTEEFNEQTPQGLGTEALYLPDDV